MCGFTSLIFKLWKINNILWSSLKLKLCVCEIFVKGTEACFGLWPCFEVHFLSKTCEIRVGFMNSAWLEIECRNAVLRKVELQFECQRCDWLQRGRGSSKFMDLSFQLWSNGMTRRHLFLDAFPAVKLWEIKQYVSYSGFREKLSTLLCMFEK